MRLKSFFARIILLTVLVTGISFLASAQASYSFSCLINGQSFAESGTSTLANSAYKTAPDIISVTLVSTDTKYKNTVPPQIALYFAPNGSTSIKGSGGKYSAKYSMAGELDNDFVAVSVTVNVISLSADRIKGSFSGKFANNSKTVLITDGKFDFPASKYSKPLK